MGSDRSRKNRPKKKTAQSITPRTGATTNNDATPRFCLRDLQSGFTIEDLDTAGRAAFAMALHKRRQMSWKDLIFAPRHGLGSETIKTNAIRPTLPTRYEDRDSVLVFRYDNKKPMVGVRIEDTFHILWIEKNFGDVYDHG